MRTHIQALLLNRLLQRHEPFSIVHFITERCNARCSHCFIDFDKPPDRVSELKIEEIELLTRTTGQSLYNINITGGEPFLREELFEIIACYVKNSQVRSIVITTNGWFTDAVQNLIERYSRLETPCRLTISISVDNLQLQHDAGRQLPGLLTRALASYRAVDSANNPRIIGDIAITVTDKNAANITNIYQHLAEAGVVNLTPILVRQEGTNKFVVDQQNVTEAYQKLTHLTESSRTANHDLLRALHRAKNRISHRILHNTSCNPRFISPCRAGSLFGSISSDGTVFPCEVIGSKMPLGNLRDYNMDFLKLWQGEAAEKARKSIRETKCNCTFECAWSVNILTTPRYWPSLVCTTLKELL